MSFQEKLILRGALKEAKKRLKAGLGPRAIRSILFRYQLARLILDELKTPLTRQEDVKVLTRLLASRSLFGEEDTMADDIPPNIREVVEQVT